MSRRRSPEARARQRKRQRERKKAKRAENRAERARKKWNKAVWEEYRALRAKLMRKIAKIRKEAAVQVEYKEQARHLVKDNLDEARHLGEDRDKYLALRRARDYREDEKAATTELEILGDVITQLYVEIEDARLLAERLTWRPKK